MPHPPLLLRSLFVLTALTLLSACEGSTGPAGGQGPAGVQGPEGPPGEPGSVNMFYSPWISFQGGQWNQVTEFGRITQLYDITEGLVTQDVIDQGLVLVYLRLAGASAPLPLPYTGFVTSSSTDQHLRYRLTTERITLVFNNIGNGTNPGTFGSSNSYRYVIIPGGTSITANVAANLSYDEMRRLLGIPPD